jgi:hypothetical protein
VVAWFVAVTACVGAGPATEPAARLTWPRTFTGDVGTIKVYQPQVESWEGNKLAARAAVAVTPAGEAEPTYGVISLTARTDVDKTNRIVTLADLRVTQAQFPERKGEEQKFLAAIRKHVPEGTREVPLDHLEANLEMTQAAAKARGGVAVKNDPPRIIFSKTPALLVLIDGDPALRQVEGQTLMRVINTRAMIVLEQVTNRYYLHAMGRWYGAAAPTGPWAVADTGAPPGVDALLDSLAKAKVVDRLDPSDPNAAPQTPPTVYVSTKPAELIQTAGEPEYTPVAGTKLLYATNTDSALFMYVTTQRYYALLSGRWFAAASLDGPWAYVAGKDLPGDFAKIPPDSPKGNVLVSVPGTPQAREAVIANSIPETATVNVADTHLTVDYDGQPQFKPIDGAAGLSYAVNTALPVVRVDEANTYWCVQNGVWFTAAAPAGPWAVATDVPPVIYTIPVSSPVHYVTYVRVYGSTPDAVYVGYTPGYMGTCVTPDGVVVYGTGYYYPAYVGTTAWVGYPPTYGYGAGFAYGPATGFAFGFAAGAMVGGAWCQPYWGPCYGYGHVDINNTSVYNNWRGGVTYTNRHYSYNPWTGTSTGGARAATFNPYSGRASAGGYATYFDRSSGEFGARQAGATYNPNTGVVRAGGRGVSGNAYDGNAEMNRGAARYNTRTDTGVARYDNNVYAARDGNVYRYNGNDGWQQRTSGGWQNAERANPSFAQQRSGFDQQRYSRDVGQQRFSTGSYRAMGGGGFRGGGGRR